MGIGTPEDIAEATVIHLHQSRVADQLAEWAADRLRDEEVLWLPIIEGIRAKHGIGYAIRFASVLNTKAKLVFVADWLDDVCDALR